MGGPRIFIAEGAPAVSERLVKMVMGLSDAIIVGEAHKSRDVLEGIREKCPDILILDMDLEGSGLSVLKTAKIECPEMKVIMLSDHPDGVYRDQCLKSGADQFLDKSGEIDKLLEAITTEAKRT